MKDHVKQNYINLVNFLGTVMGSNCEVVFHVIEPEGAYIAAIKNNHISGRSENAPLTGLALQFMQNKVYLNSDYIANYKGASINNKNLKSATYFIKDEFGNLEGMLCFNIDISMYIETANYLYNFAQMPMMDNQYASNETKSDVGEVVEYFSDSIKDIIASVVPIEDLQSNINFKQSQKIEIIRQLYNKGIFKIKGAVSNVAEIINVSEPSVYRYLKIVEVENK